MEKLTKAKRHVIYTLATEGFDKINKYVLCNAISCSMTKMENGHFTPQPDLYEKLPKMFEEFGMFKPRGVKEGEKWWGTYWDNKDEDNDARYFALAMMLEMTRTPKKKKKK